MFLCARTRLRTRDRRHTADVPLARLRLLSSPRTGFSDGCPSPQPRMPPPAAAMIGLARTSAEGWLMSNWVGRWCSV